MNNSKKALRRPEKKKVAKNTINPTIWIIISVVLIVALFGAVLYDRLYKRVILTIEDDKYYIQDLGYYFFNVESEYNYYNQYLGGSYYDMVADEKTGLTYRDIAKQQAIDTAMYTELMYREAIANNYSLTDEQKETVNTNVNDLLNNTLSKSMAKKNGFTKEYLTDIISKTTLVNTYRLDIIDSLDVDDDEIKAGINKDEYKRHDIEYLFISTKIADEQGEYTDMTQEEKAEALNKIKAIENDAATTEDWSTLIPEDEDELVYYESYYLESDTSKFDAGLTSMMAELDNGEISDIYEAANGYYIVRMINNNSTKSYDEAVLQAISTAETEAYQKYYTETVMPKYKYDVKEKAVKRLNMGQITLG